MIISYSTFVFFILSVCNVSFLRIQIYFYKKDINSHRLCKKNQFAKDALMFKNANIIFVSIIKTHLISFAMYRHFLIENVMPESCLQFTKCKILYFKFQDYDLQNYKVQIMVDYFLLLSVFDPKANELCN